MSSSLWDGMSRRQFETLKRTARLYADRLGLMDWRLYYSTVPVDADPQAMADTNPGEDPPAASVYPLFGQKSVRLAVCRGWNRLPERERRYALTHELVHLHHFAIDDFVQNDVAKAVGSEPAVTLLRQVYTREMEFLIDAWSDVAADFVPRYATCEGKGKSSCHKHKRKREPKKLNRRRQRRSSGRRSGRKARRRKVWSKR